tara:strand:- start:520 stop:843 length:324 start_codon:yes stop_codon:yes gene_type:complete
MDIYKLKLVNRRWDALLNGEKLDTIRLKEGKVRTPCFIEYENCDYPEKKAIVYAYSSEYILLKDVPNEPNKEDFLNRMKRHYPDITLNTEILFIEHLSVDETKSKYL